MFFWNNTLRISNHIHKKEKKKLHIFSIKKVHLCRGKTCTNDIENPTIGLSKLVLTQQIQKPNINKPYHNKAFLKTITLFIVVVITHNTMYTLSRRLLFKGIVV